MKNGSNIMPLPDVFFMQKAIRQAHKSLKNKDVPVGAVIVYNEKIIGRGYNQIEMNKDPLAHAEIIAIRNAVKKIGYKHLLNCTMYITLEPCSMCAGAIVLSRVSRVVIGARDPKTGACGSLYNIISDNRLNHKCLIEYDILKNECSMLLKNFFKELRLEK